MIFKTTPEQKVELYKIATSMKTTENVSDKFVSDVVAIAEQSQGAFDLMALWRDEKTQKERNEIIADLQEVIDDWKAANEKR